MLLMAAMTVMASCASVKKTASLDAINGEWNIVKINGKDITATPLDSRAFIGFDVAAKRVYGCAGCNRMTGALQADAATGVLTFDDKMAMTRMMCANPQLNELDNTISEMLKEGAQVDLTANQLTLATAKQTLTYKLADLMN